MENTNKSPRSAKKITETVYDLVDPVAQAQELVIWDVEYQKEGGRYVLRITIDREDGVDLEHCEAFHRAIDPVLDEVDPTFGAPYTLNVSSPGLDRPLKTDRDFAKCIGKKVEVRLFAPIKGKKFFELVLNGHDENCVYLQEKDGEWKLEKAKIAKISRAIDFDGLL